MPAARTPVAKTPAGKAVVERLSQVLEGGLDAPFVAHTDAQVGLSLVLAPKQELPLRVAVESGRLSLTAGSGEADLVFTVSVEDGLALLRGELDPSVAFMRGRLKPAGDNALLLQLLENTSNGALSEWAAASGIPL